jgi:alkylated DNA repair dioxygenase AlkB
MIDGLKYFHNFIGEDEEKELIRLIDAEVWSMDLKRRTQHYGYKYDYTKKRVDSSMYVGLIPAWIASYCTRLTGLGFKKKPDQVIINEYLPGQGIAKHVDCVSCFGETVASLSLGSTCSMEFEHVDSHKIGSTILGPRSMLILSGPARYEWMHSISARKEDVFDGEPLPRGRRISLTFRTVKLDLL